MSTDKRNPHPVDGAGVPAYDDNGEHGDSYIVAEKSTSPVGPPELSPLGQRVLSEAHERDLEVASTTWFPHMRAVRERLFNLGDEQREALCVDGLRWRRHCSQVETRFRYEAVERERRRLAVESERAMRTEFERMGGARGPSYRELARLRSTPAWVAWCCERGCRAQLTLGHRPDGTEQCPRHRDDGGA